MVSIAFTKSRIVLFVIISVSSIAILMISSFLTGVLIPIGVGDHVNVSKNSIRRIDSFGDPRVEQQALLSEVLICGLFGAAAAIVVARWKRPWLILAASGNPIVFLLAIFLAQQLAQVLGFRKPLGLSPDPRLYLWIFLACGLGTVLGVALGGNLARASPTVGVSRLRRL